MVVALHALKAPCVDDGQCAQVGQGLHEFLLDLRKVVRLGGIRAHDADRLAVRAQGHAQHRGNTFFLRLVRILEQRIGGHVGHDDDLAFQRRTIQRALRTHNRHFLKVPIAQSVGGAQRQRLTILIEQAQCAGLDPHNAHGALGQALQHLLDLQAGRHRLRRVEERPEIAMCVGVLIHEYPPHESAGRPHPWWACST